MDYEERLGGGVYQPGGFARERLPEGLDKTGEGLEPDIHPDVEAESYHIHREVGRIGEGAGLFFDNFRQQLAGMGQLFERVPVKPIIGVVALVAVGGALLSLFSWKKTSDAVGETLIDYGNKLRSVSR